MGALQVDGRFQCYTIEDGGHFEKVAGETRIPAGTYEVLLRNEGGRTKEYAEDYPEMHRGMLWLQDVPGFEWVYIHRGNTAEHTEGCILVGDAPNNNTLKEGFCGSSGDAYQRIYPTVAGAIESGESVLVTVRDVG
jgi:hypothetical protein